jgi:hypothetical protein
MRTSNKKIEFYEERAEEAADDARNAILINVRERALRSEAAWREMANRAIAVEDERARKLAEAETIQRGRMSFAGLKLEKEHMDLNELLRQHQIALTNA